jgi:hypothetical protein
MPAMKSSRTRDAFQNADANVVQATGETASRGSKRGRAFSEHGVRGRQNESLSRPIRAFCAVTRRSMRP